MAQPTEKPLPPTPPTTENPVLALGRKVKSAFISDQEPSIRIRRELSLPGARNVNPPQDIPEKHTEGPGPGAAPSDSTASNGFTGRLRSIFGRQDGSKDSRSDEQDYDNDMVDLLDVLGM